MKGKNDNRFKVLASSSILLGSSILLSACNNPTSYCMYGPSPLEESEETKDFLIESREDEIESNEIEIEDKTNENVKDTLKEEDVIIDESIYNGQQESIIAMYGVYPSEETETIELEKE